MITVTRRQELRLPRRRRRHATPPASRSTLGLICAVLVMMQRLAADD
jgi:hypothetical protein